MRTLFLVSLFVSIIAGAASASDWIIERTTRDVSVSTDGRTWVTATAGQTIPNAAWVRTGTRGRLVLAKGSERILYRENTLAAIAVSEPTGQKTRVTQRKGSILLDVERRRTQHTSVVTPHLAAVVKGTVFEVTVAQDGSSVRVDEGVVAVSDGSDSVDVEAGRQASASARNTGVSVTASTTSSLARSGVVGLELAEIASDGRAGGSENSNAGGNGKSNAGGNGKSNAGGNGNGNAGGNGKSNAGGNGKSNAGGNGKSNAGGNGKGKGN